MVDRRLRDHLTALGATHEQLDALDTNHLVIGLAGDLQLADGLTRTVDELAGDTGCTPAEIRSIYMQFGLDADGLAGFGAGDVELVSLVTNDESGIVDQVGPPLMRVAGTLLARLAEANVAAYVQDVESADDDGADLVELADRNAFASALAMVFGAHLPTLFRHHMWVAVRRQRDAQLGVVDREALRIAVGFVDLVGFTSRSGALTPAVLIDAIEDFERRAFATAARHGGRIVKSIGDEVMIAGPDAAAVAAIALDLIAETGDDPAIAPRGGVSGGDVLFRLGDYYGPVVNLAARLTTEAVPGEVLTDLAELDSPDLTVTPGGRRLLKGFAEPVTVWTIERAG